MIPAASAASTRCRIPRAAAPRETRVRSGGAGVPRSPAGRLAARARIDSARPGVARAPVRPRRRAATGWGVVSAGGKRRGLARELRADDVQLVETGAEDVRARHGAKKDGPQRIDVGAGGHGPTRNDLFGSHVLDGPQDHVAESDLAALHLVDEAPHPEVDDGGARGAISGRMEDDVAGLEVAVDDRARSISSTAVASSTPSAMACSTVKGV